MAGGKQNPYVQRMEPRGIRLRTRLHDRKDRGSEKVILGENF